MVSIVEAMDAIHRATLRYVLYDGTDTREIIARREAVEAAKRACFGLMREEVDAE